MGFFGTLMNYPVKTARVVLVIFAAGLIAGYGGHDFWAGAGRCPAHTMCD